MPHPHSHPVQPDDTAESDSDAGLTGARYEDSDSGPLYDPSLPEEARRRGSRGVAESESGGLDGGGGDDDDNDDDDECFGPEDDPMRGDYVGGKEEEEEGEGEWEEEEQRERLDRSVEMEESEEEEKEVEEEEEEVEEEEEGTDTGKETGGLKGRKKTVEVVDPRVWEVPKVRVTSSPGEEEHAAMSSTSAETARSSAHQTFGDEGRKRKGEDTPPDESERKRQA